MATSLCQATQLSGAAASHRGGRNLQRAAVPVHRGRKSHLTAQHAERLRSLPAGLPGALTSAPQQRRHARRPLCARADAAAAVPYEGSSVPAGPSTAAKMRQVYITSAVDMLSYSFVFPLLPFFAQKFGAAPTDIGLLVATFALTQTIAAPFLGKLSDRMGRKPLMMLTILGTFTGFLIFANANSLWMLFLARFIDGATGGNSLLAQAYISDITPRGPERATAFAFQAAAGSVGFIVGPVLGGVLAGQYGLQAPAYLAAALAFLNLLGVFFLLPESLPKEERQRLYAEAQAVEAAAPLRGRFSLPRLPPAIMKTKVQTLLLIKIAWALPYTALTSVLTLVMAMKFGMNPKETGTFLAFVGLLQIGAQAFLIKPLVKAFRENALLLTSLGVGALGLVGWAYAPSVLVTAAIMFPIGIASGVFQTVAQAAMSRAAGQGDVGAVLGIGSALESACRVVGPIASGALLSSMGPHGPGVVGAVVAAAGWVLSFARMRDDDEDDAREEAAAAATAAGALGGGGEDGAPAVAAATS